MFRLLKRGMVARRLAGSGAALAGSFDLANHGLFLRPPLFRADRMLRAGLVQQVATAAKDGHLDFGRRSG